MADNFQASASKELFLSSLSRCVLVKWKVAANQKVSKGSILAVYKEIRGSKDKESDLIVLPKLKSDTGGLVKRLLVAEGEKVQPGQPVILLDVCKHTTIMKDMCAECGLDLRSEPGIPGNFKEPVSASVALVHNIPELRVSKEEAEVLGTKDKEVLLKNKKLVLLVDLDQTLIHTTNENVPPDMKDVYHFQLYGQNIWYHTKFRPGWKTFLEDMSKYYELHIFTMGSRMYAHTIARMLDPTGELFAERIRSRDESFDMYSKYRDLRILFPCDDSMVCIIDDREDIWDCAPNLVTVKPYRFFHGTGDINAPLGLGQAFTHPSVIPMHEDVHDAAFKWDTTKEPSSAPEDRTNHVAARDDEKEEVNIKISEDPQKVVDNLVEDGAKSSKKGSGNGGVVNEEDSDPVTEITKGITNHLSATEASDQANNSCKCGVNGANGMVSDACERHGYSKEEEEEIKCSKFPESDKSDEVMEAIDTQECRGEDRTAEDASDGDDKGSNDITEDGEITNETCDGVLQPKDMKEVVYDSSNNVDVKETERHDGDTDDYLLYLEDILRRIHARFYEISDNLKKANDGEICSGTPPDLRSIMPELRQAILKGANIVFTGVIPTNCRPEESQVWRVASQFGANVTKDLLTRKTTADRSKRSTHVVAARPGTEKACQALRLPNVNLVNPNWLWTCAERWESVDERLFPVEDYERYKARRREETPPISRPTTDDLGSSSTDVYSKNYAESRGCFRPYDEARSREEFTDAMNPFLSFSSGEMEEMDKEVEDLMRSSEDEDECGNDEILGSVSSSSSSSEAESNGPTKVQGITKGKTVQFSTIKQSPHQLEAPLSKRRKLDFCEEGAPSEKELKTDETSELNIEGEFSSCEESNNESGSSDEEGGNDMAAMLEAAIYS